MSEKSLAGCSGQRRLLRGDDGAAGTDTRREQLWNSIPRAGSSECQGLEEGMSLAHPRTEKGPVSVWGVWCVRRLVGVSGYLL